ncbi:MAG: alpha/beta hydrolase [Bacteriovorax sp.]|nr:alpha/beta hydrolase [Bacteriovorax sp.]
MQALTIKRDFGELSYYKDATDANAPVLLGLSGFGCTHYNYLDLLPELTKNFQVVLIDNRGMGSSSKTISDYTLRDVAADALAVMDELKIDTFGLMGISMGGFIAQELIKLAPARVSAVALMCTLSSGPDFVKPVAITEEGLRQFNTLDARIQAEYSTIATVHPTLKEKNPTQYQKIVDFRVNFKADLEESVRQNKAAVAFLNAPYDLSIIKCPALAMAGAVDRFVSPKNVEAFAKNIKQCQTAFIPESDHFFFLEKPAEVSMQLNRFFKEVLV